MKMKEQILELKAQGYLKDTYKRISLVKDVLIVERIIHTGY